MRRKLTSILLGMAIIIILSGCTMVRGSDKGQDWTSEDASEDSVFADELDGLADVEEGISIEPTQ